MGLVRRNWILIMVILGADALAVAFRLNQKPEIRYFTAKVEQGDIRQVIGATGTINPATLETGINPELFQGAVLQAQADLKNAQATLTAAKANLAKDGAC